MPTLTIGDKQVSVGDEFLKLSPEQQNSAVADIAKSIGGAAPASPVTANQVLGSAAEGVPFIGGARDHVNAAVNATLAPVVEPFLAPSDKDISRKGETWSQRYGKSKEMLKADREKFATEHPIVDAGAKITGGTLASIPMMMAMPAAFGLTGTLPQMVGRGALSNAAVGGIDALTRGEDPLAPAAVGGALGATLPLAGRVVGKLASGVREWRNPTPPVAQNVERVGGVDVPMTSGQVAQDPAIQAEEEIMRRGGRGTSAEAIARQADEEAQRAIGEASGNISRSLDPTAASARTAPQDAAQAVQSELAAAATARQAAEAQRALQVGQEGESLARGLGGGAAPASPFDAAEKVGVAVAARRAQAVERTKAAYKARDEVAGEFDPSVLRGLAEDIRARLNTGPAEERIHVDPVNETVANKALKIIDQTVGRDSGLFANAAGPKPPEVAAAARDSVGISSKATEDETVAALRAKFGDSVADAYAKQNAPPPLSLLEFIASKGGLKPNSELDAIGMNHGHRSQIPGQKGFFGTVRKNGDDIDRMREAAEEAGYFRGNHEGTSTPREFLDAIDAELRGQKKYPEGFEGFKNKRQVAGAETRQSADMEAINHGFERDLADAGHGEAGPDIKARAAALMRDEGMAADDAMEAAFRQLEQEDAVGGAAAVHHGVFPGDKPAAAAAPVAAQPVDLRKMDEARKQLVTMYGDAKSRAIATGDKADLRAMGRILHEFDNSISDALASGKFSGDAAMAKELQDAARAAHAEYKQTYSAKPGDEIGRAVEKILGRYSDTAATPEQIQALSYGPKSNPGTGNSVKVAGRLKKILSEAEYGQWKQGLFGYVDDASLSPAKRAARIDNFLNSSLAKGALTAEDRSAMGAYSRKLRATEPASGPLSKLQQDIARIDGTDGHRPATMDEVRKMIIGNTGGDAQRLVVHLKGSLTPESWTKLRQSWFDDLVNAPDGHNAYTPLQKAKRISDYLGNKISEHVNTSAERAEMAKLASIYRRQVPLPGTTNPSGTAPMLAKIANKASNNILALIGLGAHGVSGAIVGHGIQTVGSALKEAKAAKEATRLFFRPQARRAVGHSRVPQLIGASAIPASQRDSR